MADYPALFNDEMVRAIMAGLKTQTRRPVKLKRYYEHGSAPDCHWLDCGVEPEKQRFGIRGPLGEAVSPFGGPGDRIWVREAWRMGGSYMDMTVKQVEDLFAVSTVRNDHLHYRSDEPERAKDTCWRPSIHMPKWACRTFLPVLDVRVERVQDITEADAIAEGCGNQNKFGSYRNYLPGLPRYISTARESFLNLWDSIYAARGLGVGENPPIWVATFQAVK